MRKVPLSTIATVFAGQGAPKPNEFSDSGIPFVRAGSLEDLLSGKKEADLELVPAETAKKRTLKLYPKGSILFAKSGMSATKGRIYVLQNPAYVVSHLAILTPKDNVHAQYLRLALKQFPPSVLIKDPAYPAIGLGEIQNYKIPVPEEPDDQKRIAHLLGKVERLIARRKQHLQQLDDLLKSVFRDMFGDLSRNEKNFDEFTLNEIKAPGNGSFSNGPFGSDLLTSELSEAGDVPVIYIRDIRDGCFRWASNVFVTKEKARSLSNCRVTIGDLLVSKVGDPPGIAAINFKFPDAIITQDVIRLRTDTSIASPYFIKSLLNSSYGKWLIKKITIKGTRSRFPLKAFKELKIPLPPIELQNQLVAIVEKVDGLKARYQQNLTDLENLYGALSQEAFNGELDLSRVVLPTKQSEFTQEKQSGPSVVVELPPTITLPAPDDLNILLSVEGRKAVIEQWLDSYLGQLGSSVFSADSFMEAAQQRLWKLLEDEESELPELGIAEYDQLKAWVFQALGNGHLRQSYDDAGNRVQVKSALG